MANVSPFDYYNTEVWCARYERHYNRLVRIIFIFTKDFSMKTKNLYLILSDWQKVF